MLTRRQALVSGMSGCLPFAAMGAVELGAVDLQTPLGELGRSKGMAVGAAVSSIALRDDAAFADLLRRQRLGVVPEWEMKWHALRPTRERFDMAPCDAIVRHASEHQVLMRAHPLVWHASMPSWALEGIRSGQGERLMLQHIDRLAERYGRVIQSWDVVNEAIWIPDGQPGGLRRGVWLDAMGPRYVELAFQHAALRLPHQRLVYNEYNIEYEAAKGQAVLRLIDGVRKRGGRVDAVGLQSHLWTARRRLDLTALTAFLRACRREGLDVVITELDVRESAYDDAPARRDRLVADVVQAYLSTVFAEVTPKELFFWGLSDRYSWLSNPRYNRENPAGHLNRGLPFDAALNPKLLWSEVVSMVERLPNAS